MELEARSSHNSQIAPAETDSNENEKANTNDKANAARISAKQSNSSALVSIAPATQTRTERVIFSTTPDILLDQAQRIEVWPLAQSACNDSTSSTRSSSFRPSHSHLLMFARDIRERVGENETVTGCEMVAYPCDQDGRVALWTHRYACCALNFPLAAQKLRLQIVNEMATLHHIENL